MIGLVRGTVVSMRESERGCECVVEAGGIGYRLAVLPATLERMTDFGSEALLYTHLHVREDALGLYGFETEEERDVFETLLGAGGVGPRLALAILAVHSPRALRKAVVSGDAGALTMVSGIGSKTAQKLLLELQDRLGAPSLDAVGARSDLPLADVRAALAGLGYGSEEIREAISDLDGDGEPDALLRLALRRLADRVREA